MFFMKLVKKYAMKLFQSYSAFRLEVHKSAAGPVLLYRDTIDRLLFYIKMTVMKS